MQRSGFSAPNRLSFQRSRKKNLYNLWAPPTFATLLVREEDKKTTTIAVQLVKSEKQLATTTAFLLCLLACFIFQLAISASAMCATALSCQCPGLSLAAAAIAQICLTNPVRPRDCYALSPDTTRDSESCTTTR
jgi:hypothetical protein